MKSAVLALGLALSACARDAPAPTPSRVALGGETVVQVSDTAIPASLVAEVARTKRISVHAALEALIDDALAAKGASLRGLDADVTVLRDLTAFRARLVANRVRDESRAAGTPTDAEVEELTKQHWRDVDVPEQVRVIHVVARKVGGDSATDAQARHVASAIASRVAQATSADEFEALATAVLHEKKVEVRVERLASFGADGRTSEGAELELDRAFATAAFALSAPGATSAVVESSSGFHVIRLLSRIPARQLPLEGRRTLFTEEAFALRARRDFQAILKRVSTRVRVEVKSDAESLMAEVSSPRRSP